jgi:uncharacterized protein (TIGR02266 family)
MTAKKNATKNTGRSKKTSAPSTKASSEEDRSGRRVPIQLLVDYKADGNYLFDFCKDLGTGGVFIQTTKPMPAGSSIDLTFTIPDSKETLITKGTVIWVQDVVPDRKDLTPGMGVQFRGFSGDQRRLLEEFVTRYHGRGMVEPPSSGKRAG